MPKNLIVSTADKNYEILLKELYKSQKNLTNYDFAILDCGMSESSKAFFRDDNVQIKIPKWEVELPSLKIRGRDYLKSSFSKFYMQEYFPGYENYIWLDSDTWINCEKTFEMYIHGANEKGFAICPQIDRASPRLINIKWFYNFPIKVNSINYKNLSRSVSRKLGRKYAGYFTLNGGCFSYNSKFKDIEVLRKNLKIASRKGRIFGTDQVALAITTFEDGIEFEMLPSYCNWICEHHLPKFCEKRKIFVEPYVPHHNIAIIHLAGLDDERQHDHIKHDIITLNKNVIKKSLRFDKLI